jgi:hypothetical protein
VLLLYLGSLGVPHTIKSWSGESEPEKWWRWRTRLLVWVGIPFAIVAVGCQNDHHDLPVIGQHGAPRGGLAGVAPEGDRAKRDKIKCRQRWQRPQ